MKSMTQKIADDWKDRAYYKNAEEKDALLFFWRPGLIRSYFDQLDTSHIVELACGHGRHVKVYKDLCKTISLVDVNQENIDFCKNRYKDDKNIYYILTSGNNFSGIEDASKTAVFSYDSMVHFELTDILSYLQDSYRILQMGGKVLFHHSNYAANPGGVYSNNPHWRNFLSADIFSHLATRAGFNVLSQSIMNWSTHYNLDCISLCQKV